MCGALTYSGSAGLSRSSSLRASARDSHTAPSASAEGYTGTIPDISGGQMIRRSVEKRARLFPCTPPRWRGPAPQEALPAHPSDADQVRSGGKTCTRKVRPHVQPPTTISFKRRLPKRQNLPHRENGGGNGCAPLSIPPGTKQTFPLQAATEDCTQEFPEPAGHLACGGLYGTAGVDNIFSSGFRKRQIWFAFLLKTLCWFQTSHRMPKAPRHRRTQDWRRYAETARKPDPRQASAT